MGLGHRSAIQNTPVLPLSCFQLQGNSGPVPTKLLLISGAAGGGGEPLDQSGTNRSPKRPNYPGIPCLPCSCNPEGHLQMYWKQRIGETYWVSVYCMSSARTHTHTGAQTQEEGCGRSWRLQFCAAVFHWVALLTCLFIKLLLDFTISASPISTHTHAHTFFFFF